MNERTAPMVSQKEQNRVCKLGSSMSLSDQNEKFKAWKLNQTET
jgi:hypothetical protein